MLGPLMVLMAIGGELLVTASAIAPSPLGLVSMVVVTTRRCEFFFFKEGGRPGLFGRLYHFNEDDNIISTSTTK